MPADNSNCLIIKRLLSAEKGSNTTICRPQTITMLNDEGGGNILVYQKALSGEKTKDTVILEYNGIQFDPLSQCRIGFGERLPDTGIREFLAEAGFEADEIEKAIDVCELRKHLFYKCGQLAATQARQLQLMRALKTQDTVLLLNDPFQPFNGRWREYFAEALLRDLREKARVIVVMNLSFVPQAWTASGVILEADISKIIRPDQIKKEKEAAKAAENDLQKTSAMDAASLERQAIATLRIPIPEPLSYAYRQTADFIFEPLAKLTETFGYYGAVAVMVGMALFIGIGATVLYSNLGGFRITKDMIHVEPAHPQPVQEKGQQAVAENEPVKEAVNETSDEPPTDIIVEEQPGETIVEEPKTLQGDPACLVENDEFNLWYWSELPPPQEKIFSE